MATGENVDDLFQVGCIGLIKALDNFDVSQNVRFSTYAVPMIIGRFAATCGQQRHPGKPEPAGHRLQGLKARDRMAERLGREPNVSELAQELGLPP